MSWNERHAQFCEQPQYPRVCFRLGYKGSNAINTYEMYDSISLDFHRQLTAHAVQLKINTLEVAPRYKQQKGRYNYNLS